MIVGTLHCIASSGEIPKGSDTEGMIYTSLAFNTSYTCFPFINPGKWKRSAIPRSAARRIIAFIISPLPAITKRILRVRFSTIAAASTKYSGPFCIVIRPKNVTIFSFGFLRGTISCISFGNGDTALCIVNTLRGS